MVAGVSLRLLAVCLAATVCTAVAVIVGAATTTSAPHRAPPRRSRQRLEVRVVVVPRDAGGDLADVANARSVELGLPHRLVPVHCVRDGHVYACSFRQTQPAECRFARFTDVDGVIGVIMAGQVPERLCA